MNEYSPEKEMAERCRRKDFGEACGIMFLIWFLTGFVGFHCGQFWMVSWWGFWLVGVPYGLGLLALPIAAYVRKNRQHPLD